MTFGSLVKLTKADPGRATAAASGDPGLPSFTNGTPGFESASSTELEVLLPATTASMISPALFWKYNRVWLAGDEFQETAAMFRLGWIVAVGVGFAVPEDEVEDDVLPAPLAAPPVDASALFVEFDFDFDAMTPPTTPPIMASSRMTPPIISHFRRDLAG